MAGMKRIFTDLILLVAFFRSIAQSLHRSTCGEPVEPTLKSLYRRTQMTRLPAVWQGLNGYTRIDFFLISIKRAKRIEPLNGEAIELFELLERRTH
jgi:hypothetical protein